MVLQTSRMASDTFVDHLHFSMGFNHVILTKSVYKLKYIVCMVTCVSYLRRDCLEECSHHDIVMCCVS